MSLRERREREGVEVKRGRPLGPTLRVGSFSSMARRRARACASETAASTSAGAASSPDLLNFPFLPLVAVVDSAFFTE